MRAFTRAGAPTDRQGRSRGHRGAFTKVAAAGALATALFTASLPPAQADLLPIGPIIGVLGQTVNGTVGVVGGLLEVVTAGWDDGVTAPPTEMTLVNSVIGATTMWQRGFDGRGIDVAVIDTGVVPAAGLDGPGKVVDGPDLSFESQSPDLAHLDTYGHGTHMAGIVAGAAADGSYMGVAPGARVVSVKVGAHDGAVDVSQVIAAIDWAVQHRQDNGLNIRVLSLSFGTDSTQNYRIDPLAHAVEGAWRAGIVVVASGGNDGTAARSLVNPAIDPYVLAVGAADLKTTRSSLDDRVAPFSSRGNASRAVDLIAPGVSIVGPRNPNSAIDAAHPGAIVRDRFFRGSGTSQATAVTAGAVALLLDARPDLTPDEVKALMKATATPVLWAGQRDQGAGRLDVARAARSAVPWRPTQRWEPSTGTGSLEAARGTSHVADEGIELVGELDIMGQAWNGPAWAAASAMGTSWVGGTWNGAVWTGDCWCSTTWSGTSWSGTSWTGTSWTGRTWLGRTWLGRTWLGGAWVGDSWTDGTWTGRTWLGRLWLSAPSGGPGVSRR